MHFVAGTHTDMFSDKDNFLYFHTSLVGLQVFFEVFYYLTISSFLNENRERVIKSQEDYVGNIDLKPITNENVLHQQQHDFN
jgi:hypothetical protein